MILITGATGNVGRNLVISLHAAGHPVRALARHALTEAFPAGVEVFAGDLTDPATIRTALDGVTAAFLFPVFGGIAAFCDAARDQRLDRVVLLSSGAVTFDEPGWIGEQHQLLEEQVRGTGVPACFVRPDVFMANDLAWATSISQTGTVSLAYPEAATAPIDERDIAAVAHTLLLNTNQDAAGNDDGYLVTGPESLTQADRVAILAATLGRPVELVELTPEAATADLQQTGMPAEAASFLLNTLRSRAGTPAATTDTVRQVTGHPARTYRHWAEHRKADFAPR